MIRRTRHKYGAVRTEGRASKLETSVYQMLELMKRAGEIESIEEQSAVQLCDALKCKIDFKVMNRATGRAEYHEAKGVDTDRWTIVKAHWRKYGPGDLHVWKGSYRSPRLVETIEGGMSHGSV